MKLQQGKIVNIAQGSELWAELRAKRFTASEAPAMMGQSKYQSRNDLLKQKATGLASEVSEHQQRIFDKGHRAEAVARIIAEKEIGEDLFPIVLDDEEGGFLASMDGLTMMGDIGWECKLASESLFAQIEAGKLEEHYMIQLDQQFALSGADRILFTACDEKGESYKHLWIERDESRFKALEAGWQQFAKDLSEYQVPEAEQPKAEGKAPDALPSLVIRASGMVESSNLAEFEAVARASLAGINTDLQTDTDFANAEKAVKFCKDVETRLKATKDQVIGQMSSVDEVVRLLDSLDEEFRQKRLKLNKDVTAQKEQRKQEILLSAKQDYDTFARSLDVGRYMPIQMPDFAGAMKGKRTISSLKGACDDLMAQAKIEANELAAVIRSNLKQMDEHADGYRFMFSDLHLIVSKPADDFAAIVKSRIADHQQAEQKRLDAEREKIRREEEAKARREAEQKARAEAVKGEQAHRENQSVGEGLAATPTERPTPTPEQEDATDRHLEANGYVSMTRQGSAMPNPNDMVKVIAEHYGVGFQVAQGWLAAVEWRQAA